MIQELTILNGHVLSALATIPNDTVDLIVTSPPYWGLRDYGEETVTVWDGDPECEHEWSDDIFKKQSGGTTKVIVTQNTDARIHYDVKSNFCSKCGAWRGQLGLGPSLELYIKHLLQITAELKRVLKPTGVLFWNHGDSYGGSWQNYGNRPEESGYSEGQRIKNTEYFKRGDSVKSYPVTMSATAKGMCLQNYRLVLRMVDEQGWILRNAVIWNKTNHMPSSVKDRFTNGYEPIFMLTKSNKTAYYWNEKTGLMADRPPVERIEGRDWEWRRKKVPVSESGANIGDFNKEPYKNNNPHLLRLDTEEGELFKYSFWNSFDYWLDLDAVREPSSGAASGNRERKMHSPDNHGHMGSSVPYVPSADGKNPSDVWTMNTQPFPDAHFAVFPEELPERCIKCGCPREICTQCGKARVRITENNTTFESGSGKAGNRPNGKYGNLEGTGVIGKNLRMGPTTHVETIGWTTCCCNAEYRPGIVLDPFLGSGTIMKVARRMGMSCIGIEINPKYVAMAKREVGWNEGPFGIEFREFLL